MPSMVLKLWRMVLDQGLTLSHWWAISAIIAILTYNHYTPFIMIGGGGLFFYFLLKRKSLAFTFLMIFLFIYTDTYLQTSQKMVPQDQNQWITTIQTSPDYNGDQLSMDIQISEHQYVHGQYRMKSQTEKQALMNQLWVGMKCHVSGTLVPPESLSNFNAFDYPTYLKHKGIDYILQISEISGCQDIHPSLISRIKRMREMGIRFVNSRFPQPINGITNALVFGERNDMSPDVLQAYQTLGLVHLLSVSGLHVGMVMSLFYFLSIRLGFVKEHVRLLLLLGVIPIYAVMTGLSPSVLRASLMISMALLSTFLKVKPPPLCILSISCLLLLIVHPNVLYDIGFELSFLIVFSIIISVPIIQKRYHHIVLRTFAMTGIAQLAALPIILYHFYCVSILSFFLNLIFIPFISVIILPLAILTVFMMFLFPSLGAIFLWPLSWMIHPAHTLLLKCQNLTFFQITTGRPNSIALFILIIGILGVFILWEKWHHTLSVLLPLGFILSVGLTHHLLQWMDPNGSVTFLDVGQGDSILIQFPHAKGVMLIDTGGRLPYEQKEWQKRRDPFDIGKDVVAEQMKAAGISKINWLVLTHRDMDHIGGARALIDETPMDTIVISKEFQASDIEKAWFNKAEEKGIHIQKISSGTTWGGGELYLKALWPTQFQSTSNNRSLVLLAKLGGKTWLFTGDLEKEGELELLKLYPKLHVDILKVGHHGSRTSSSLPFIQQIRPSLAVISVGKNNHFGHPHPEVLETFKQQHIPILRTDQDGAIRIIFNKEHIIRIMNAKN